MARMQAHEIGLRTGMETLAEGRALEDKPPLSPVKTGSAGPQSHALHSPSLGSSDDEQQHSGHQQVAGHHDALVQGARRQGGGRGLSLR